MDLTGLRSLRKRTQSWAEKVWDMLQRTDRDLQNLVSGLEDKVAILRQDQDIGPFIRLEWTSSIDPEKEGIIEKRWMALTSTRDAIWRGIGKQTPGRMTGRR